MPCPCGLTKLMIIVIANVGSKLLITLLLFVSCKFHLALPHEMHVAYTVKEVASFWWAWSINGKHYYSV